MRGFGRLWRRRSGQHEMDIGRLALVLAGGLFVVVLVRSAWVAEDAYITFRTVDNFLNGHGFRWNAGERVQAYTHPLWMLSLAGAATLSRELHFTSMAVSLMYSLVVVGVLVKGVARSRGAAVLGVLMLVMSKAFVDFSISGMGNPLSHALLAVFVLMWVRKKGEARPLLYLSLLAALAAVNRLDTLFLYLPALLYLLFKNCNWRGVWSMALGFVPLIAWEVFSLFYYGFPFPNTAYAKLGTGISKLELARHGLYYLTDSISVDPITLLVILAALVSPLVLRRWHLLPLAVGVLLYILYVVWIGGDFMSGRFLTAPYLLSVLIVVSLLHQHVKWSSVAVLALVIALGGLATPRSPVLSGRDYGTGGMGRDVWHGISDERAHFFQAGGLIRMAGLAQAPIHMNKDTGLEYKKGAPMTVAYGLVGQAGYWAGPEVHIIDLFALGDPLLARLPVSEHHVDGFTGTSWRIGHFARDLPAGYYETVNTGDNLIRNPHLATYYDHLSLIIRGPLLSRDRLAAIWNMNTGRYDYLLESYLATR